MTYNVKQAAVILGIPRWVIYDRCMRLGIEKKPIVRFELTEQDLEKIRELAKTYIPVKALKDAKEKM